MPDEMIRHLILLLVGATSGKARREAGDVLDRIQSDAGFRRRLIADARGRITAMETVARRRGGR